MPTDGASPLPPGDFLAGFTVAADLKMASEVLAKAGVGFRESAGGFIIDPASAGGAELIFEAARSSGVE